MTKDNNELKRLIEFLEDKATPPEHIQGGNFGQRAYETLIGLNVLQLCVDYLKRIESYPSTDCALSNIRKIAKPLGNTRS